MKYVIGILALCLFFLFATAQMAAAYAGISHGLGTLWAVVALCAAVLLRFTLPVTVGAFFGAMQLWGWHWPAALLFSAPGLIFILPGVIPAIFSLSTRGAGRLTKATPICPEH